MLTAIYATSRVSFSVASPINDTVPTATGVMQGDPLSPTLFGINIDCVIQHLRRLLTGLAQGTTPKVPQVGGSDLHGLLQMTWCC
jgi:hypothetical protein